MCSSLGRILTPAHHPATWPAHPHHPTSWGCPRLTFQALEARGRASLWVMATLKPDTFWLYFLRSRGLCWARRGELWKQQHSMKDQKAWGLASGSKASDEIKVVHRVPDAATVTPLAPLPHRRRTWIIFPWMLLYGHQLSFIKAKSTRKTATEGFKTIWIYLQYQEH